MKREEVINRVDEILYDLKHGDKFDIDGKVIDWNRLTVAQLLDLIDFIKYND